MSTLQKYPCLIAELSTLAKWYCPHCKKVLNRNGVVIDRQKNFRHCKICNERIEFHCLKCDKVYSSAGGVIHHIKNSHGNPVKLHCNQCKYETTDKNNMTRHYLLVHTANCKKCPHCGRKMKNVAGHLKKGTCTKNRDVSASLYKCDKCRTSFNDLESFDRHAQICVKYQCEHCDLKFINKNLVKDHMLKNH